MVYWHLGSVWKSVISNVFGLCLLGITNGIDVDDWNPSTDKHVASPYSLDDTSGKVLLIFYNLEIVLVMLNFWVFIFESENAECIGRMQSCFAEGARASYSVRCPIGENDISGFLNFIWLYNCICSFFSTLHVGAFKLLNICVNIIFLMRSFIADWIYWTFGLSERAGHHSGCSSGTYEWWCTNGNVFPNNW